MGEYSGLYIKGFQVDYWKNSIGFGSELFSSDDLTQTQRPYHGNDEDYYYDDQEEDEENYTSPGYQYRNIAKEIKDRLEIMGFSMDGAKEKV